MDIQTVTGFLRTVARSAADVAELAGESEVTTIRKGAEKYQYAFNLASKASAVLGQAITPEYKAEEIIQEAIEDRVAEYKTDPTTHPLTKFSETQ